MNSEMDPTIHDERLASFQQERAAQERAYREYFFRKQKAVIVNYSELDKVDFSEVEQTRDTVRTNDEKTKCILSWQIKPTSLLQPAFLSKLSEYEGPFSILEIDHILRNPEWNGVDDNIEVDEEAQVPPYHVGD